MSVIPCIGQYIVPQHMCTSFDVVDRHPGLCSMIFRVYSIGNRGTKILLSVYVQLVAFSYVRSPQFGVDCEPYISWPSFPLLRTLVVDCPCSVYWLRPLG